MKSIFEYTDYRRWLADHLEARKAAGGQGSHRFLQQKLGVKSSGYVANIISGKKNISLEQASHLAQVLGLGRQEKGFLLVLVQFNQAVNVEDRNQHFRSLRQYSLGQSARLAPERLSLFKQWYYVALVELIQCRSVGVDPEALAKLLVPNPGVAAVQEALDDLQKWGFLVQQAGRFVRAEPTLTTGDDIQSLAVANFQRQTLDLAREAMDRFGLPERDVSCLTLAVSAQTEARLRQEIRDFRKRLLAICEEDNGPDRVVQCNFQLYPLARSTPSKR